MKTLNRIARISVVFKTLTFIASLSWALSANAQSSMTWSINSSGAKEVTSGGVPNQGDPDGSATGFLTLTNGTGGNTGVAVISLTLANIGLPDYNLGGWHIHQAPATTTGSIVVDFGQINTYLTGNSVSATIGGLSTATINNIFANSANFYLNIHSGAGGPSNPYPGGAVRDQLTVVVPEPTSMSLAVIGLAAFGFRRAWRSRH